MITINTSLLVGIGFFDIAIQDRGAGPLVFVICIIPVIALIILGGLVFISICLFCIWFITLIVTFINTLYNKYKISNDKKAFQKKLIVGLLFILGITISIYVYNYKTLNLNKCVLS